MQFRVKLGILLLTLLCVTNAPAGEVEHVDVTHDADRYHIDVTMYIEREPDTVYSLVTNYDELERISRTIIDSRIVATYADGRKRRHLVSETCIWFFCFTATMVEDVVENADRTIVTTIVPALSDYRYGLSVWHVNAANPGTRIHFQSTLEPDFWIPPLIGTWLMKRKMQIEAERTVLRLEQLIPAHDSSADRL